MGQRDTRTGWVLEESIKPALIRGGYECEMQVVIGTRLGGGKHKIDAVARKDGETILISLKWQQVSGTAEQKVPFEYICLCDALADAAYDRAYLVLGGEGWKLRAFYTEGGLEQFIPGCPEVQIVTFEGFMGLANKAEL